MYYTFEMPIKVTVYAENRQEASSKLNSHRNWDDWDILDEEEIKLVDVRRDH